MTSDPNPIHLFHHASNVCQTCQIAEDEAIISTVQVPVKLHDDHGYIALVLVLQLVLVVLSVLQ